MKLKTLVKQEWLEENSKDEKAPLPNRDNFLSSISTYEGYGKSVYRENKLREIVESTEICFDPYDSTSRILDDKFLTDEEFRSDLETHEDLS